AEDDVFLGREVAEERGRRDLGGRRDLLHRRGIVALRAEQPERVLPDGSTRPGLLPFPQAAMVLDVHVGHASIVPAGAPPSRPARAAPALPPRAPAPARRPRQPRQPRRPRRPARTGGGGGGAPAARAAARGRPAAPGRDVTP